MLKKLLQGLFGKPTVAPAARRRTAPVAANKPVSSGQSTSEPQPEGDQVYQVYEVIPRTGTVADAVTPDVLATVWRNQMPKKSAVYFIRAEPHAVPAQILEAALAVYWVEYLLTKGYNHSQMHGWLMNLKQSTDNFYGGGAIRDEMETPNSLSTSILGLVRASLHYALSHTEVLKEKLSASEFATFNKAFFGTVAQNHDERVAQIRNFKRVEQDGQIPVLLLEHFRMALEDLSLYRKVLNNPGKWQSGPAVIEQRILVHQIFQDRNLPGQFDRSNVLIAGQVFRIITVGQKRLGYSFDLGKGFAMIDMSEGIPVFYWDELIVQNAQIVEQLWTGLERLSCATGIESLAPRKNSSEQRQRSDLIAALARVSQCYLWGTLHFHDASLVSAAYSDGLKQGWPCSPKQTQRVREESPKIAAAIHDNLFDPEFAMHVAKSSQPDS